MTITTTTSIIGILLFASIATFTVGATANTAVLYKSSMSHLHGRLLEELETDDDEVDLSSCNELGTAFHQCVTGDDFTVTMDTIDCSFCTTSALFKLNFFASNEEQRSGVCDSLKSNDFCGAELDACVQESCPAECQDTVIAYADCLYKESGCDMDCASNPGTKAETVFALIAMTGAFFGWIRFDDSS